MAVLWKSIYATERARLLSGHLRSGDFFHTVNSLALKHGVSEITTRRVLSELSRDGLLRSVPRVGSIVTERVANPRIFLLSPQQIGYEEETQIVSEILKGVFEAAFELGWEVTPVSPDFLQSDYSAECHLVYLYNCNLLGSDEFLPQVPANMHLLGLHTPGPMPRGAAVCNDYRAAIDLLVTDLARSSCRIAYIGPIEGRWFQARHETYCSALRRVGCVLQDNLFLTCSPVEREISAAQILSFLSANKPEAIFFPGLLWLNLWLEFSAGAAAPSWATDLPLAAIGGYLPAKCCLPNLQFRLADGAQIGREAIKLIQMQHSEEGKSPDTVYVPFQEAAVTSP